MRALMGPVLAVIAFTALSACEGRVGGGRLVDDNCGSTGLQPLVGQPLSALTAMPLQHEVRVLQPGQVMSLEYNASRVSVTVDGAGIITRVTCG